MRISYNLVVAIVLAICLIAVPAMAKKAGEIKDNVYTDKDYKFSFQVPDGWSAKISKDKKPDRFAMTQKSYPFPRHFQGGGKEDYAQIPSMIVFADTTSMTVDKFWESLIDPKFESKQKKYFMKKFRAISKQHEVLKKKEMTLAGSKALHLEIRQAYTMEVAERGSDRADVVNDYKGAAMFLTVRNGKIIIFHMIFEYSYNGQYQDAFNRIVGSLKFE